MYCYIKKIKYFCSSISENSKEYRKNTMYLTAEKKKEFFKKYGKTAEDTGSAEGQIAMFSYRIAHLTEHLKKNKKDFGTQRALVKLVGKRRRLLNYLKERDIERYRTVIKSLKLRK